MRGRLLGLSLGLAAIGLALSASAANSPPTPAGMIMKVYRFGLSPSPTCEDMKIYSIEAPDFVDFTTNPTLGSAEVPHGTYQCVALEVDAVMTATPRAAVGACKVEPQKFDICELLALLKSAPRDSEPIDGVKPLDPGTAVFDTCKPGGDRVVLYLTTQVTHSDAGVGSNAFRPPNDASDKAHGHPLGAPLVVGPRTTGTFVVAVNAVNQGDDTSCFIDNPRFTFESSNEP